MAVTHEGSATTYEELNERADALAQRLARAGVGRGSLVALFLEPSVELVRVDPRRAQGRRSLRADRSRAAGRARALRDRRHPRGGGGDTQRSACAAAGRRRARARRRRGGRGLRRARRAGDARDTRGSRVCDLHLRGRPVPPRASAWSTETSRGSCPRPTHGSASARRTPGCCCTHTRSTSASGSCGVHSPTAGAS